MMFGSLTIALSGCATTSSTTSSAPAPAADKPVDQLGLINHDVKRIEEIARLDHQNQVQSQRVHTLETTVSQLETKLAQALSRGTDPSAQPTATATAEPTEDGGRVRVRMSGELVFEPGSARISRAGRRALKEVARVLHDTPARRIEIAGHTDSSPTNKKYEDNWQLSGERAHRVVQLLAQEGVDPHHLVAVGYGDTQPLETADTPDARAKNRRVEIFVEPTSTRSAQ